MCSIVDVVQLIFCKTNFECYLNVTSKIPYFTPAAVLSEVRKKEWKNYQDATQITDILIPK